MIYQLGFFSDIGFQIKQAIRTLSGRLAAILYDFIVKIYNVFMYVARAEVLDDKFIQNIYNRVGMILGLFMIFKLMFSLIQALVDPNKLTDDKKGFAGIIKRSIIAIVLLGITPTLFDMAFDIQGKIIGTTNSTDNIIYRIIVADSTTEKASTFGHKIATDLFFSFYKEEEGMMLEDGLKITYPDSGEVDPETGETKDAISVRILNYDNLRRMIERGDENFGVTVDYLSITKSGKYVIVWDEIFAIGVAIMVIWMLISYCIQVATRVIQLAYLQLIAPVPILSYIGDPEGTFKRWINQCVTTYLDLFLRLAVIYFIIALSTQILNIFKDVDGKLLESTQLTLDSPYLTWVKIFLILGLLMFGKKVPQLLKELFPGSSGAASSGLGMLGIKDIPGGKKITGIATGIAKGAGILGTGIVAGAVAGSVAGIRYGEGWKGKLGGAFGGLGRGAFSARTKGKIIGNVKNGLSNVKAANMRAYQRHHDGSTFMGRHMSLHAQRVADSNERELAAYENYSNIVDKINQEVDNDFYVQQAIRNRDEMLKSGKTKIKVGTAGGNPIMKTVDKSDIENYKNGIKQANKEIEEAKKQALARASSNKDSKIHAYMKQAEAIREKGIKNHQAGFKDSEAIVDADGNVNIEAYNATAASTKNETKQMKDSGGERNKAYNAAKANATYNNNK